MAKGKILVVDDEENIRGSLQSVLSDEGYEVSLAKDGEEALRMVRSEGPDLVLLDIWIPGIDGIQTLEILKSFNADTEVIMMSGHGAIDTAVKATKLGAYDFIEKPFSLDSILRTVSNALKKKNGKGLKDAGAAQDMFMDNWFAGSSRQAKAARAFIKKTSKCDDPVLIMGAFGSGKELAARLIHKKSNHKDSSFVMVSCGSISEDDFNDTLFGDPGESKSTEAASRMGGAGVIFFDRIDRLPAKLQRRMLKALVGRSVKIHGKTRKPFIKGRVIASASIAEEKESKNGILIEGLEDFFSPLTLPLTTLAQRRSDIPDLIKKFVKQFSVKYEKRIDSVDANLISALERSPLQGNTQELCTIIELASLACEGNTLTGEHIIIAGQGNMIEGSKALISGGVKAADKSYGQGKRAKKALSGGKTRSKNQQPQRTLRNSVVLCGEGLHSGLKTGLILSPLPPGSGIVFWDISSGRRLPALLEYVRSTEYATTLSDGEVTINTVEHIMSALHSYQITNLLIKIGDEAPIMDGSAIDFCQIIENGGIEEQEAYLEWIIIDKPISVGDPDNGPYIGIEPADEFSISYFLEYPPPIGRQEHEYVYRSGDHYRQTIAPARTFGFLKDIKSLEEAGLASGGKLSNFILIDSEKIINTPLRFPNEPARHKILDLIGDLYLLGRPLKGRFTAKKSGHTQNIALIKKIEQQFNVGR